MGQMILCAHFRNTILTGGFEEHFKAAVPFALKGDDALTLTDTAAYRREPP
ncbi:hypothetical protein LK494_03645 [Anaerovorax odorimutans]|nr:hypothetical protein [Anaerovorax odorimutans]